MRAALLALSLALTAAAAPASAATLIVTKFADGTPVINMAGLIADGDTEAFVKAMALKQTPQALLLKSSGGDAIVAMQIGEKARSLKAIVPAGYSCLSACALIWLAGNPRVRETGADIGFHALYVTKNGVKTVSAPGNALMGAYLAILGFRPEAIIHMAEASVDTVTPLLAEDRARYGILYQDAPPE